MSEDFLSTHHKNTASKIRNLGQVQANCNWAETTVFRLPRYFGGSANLPKDGGIEKWQPTISKDPWLFAGELVPITCLITDPEKQLSMEKAILNYLRKAQLAEYERVIISAGQNFEVTTFTVSGTGSPPGGPGSGGPALGNPGGSVSQVC